MSGETREQLHHLYGEIASDATRLKDTLASIQDEVDMRQSPSDVAFVTTLQESLDRLNAQASIAFERGLARVGK